MMGLFTTKPIMKNEVILELKGITSVVPTQTSIKIGEALHIEDEIGRFINHKCNPTSRIIGRQVIALCNLNAGDEITFNYNDNEDKLVAPFKCTCCGIMIE